MGNRAFTPSKGALRSMREVPASRECLFCGRLWGTARRSDEHVLPRWMRKHEQELLNRPHQSYSVGLDLDADARELVELPSTLVTSKSSLLTLKTRDVCADCNNGWMSRLETAARPLILTVAEAARLGEEARISREDARTLALWCQKTAATNELTSTRSRVMTGRWAGPGCRKTTARQPRVDGTAPPRL